MHRPVPGVIPTLFLVAAVGSAAACLAQDSDFNLNVHAHAHATARDIGLPEYPGASPHKEKDDSDSSADLGLVLNSFRFNLQVASFVTTDSPDKVLAFYRKPLARYGEVLECSHGKPVGRLTVTKSGLTCGDHRSGTMSVHGSDSGEELRAGTPERFRVVGIDSNDEGKTKFGLVSVVLPKEQHGN